MFNPDNTENPCYSPRTLKRREQHIAKFNELHTKEEEITNSSSSTLHSNGKIQNTTVEKHFQSPAKR